MPAKYVLVTVLLFLALAGSGLSGRAFSYGTETFPCPEELTPRVEFWVRAFTEVSRNQRLIHDSRYPWVIYEVLDVGNMGPSEINRLVRARKKHFADLLQEMVLKSPELYNEEEKRVAAAFEGVPEMARFTRARERVHSQPGVSEQFQKGLARSGRYVEAIHQILDSLQVPREISCLPHVESSFHPSAKSKAGAAGLWQFTRRTGKQFLRIDRDLDERLDPIASTYAAAKYLGQAHAILGSWPLAVVSYNHGVGGISRAQAQLGSSDIVRVLHEYDGPQFGFASQNFYCEFLAAVEIATNAEKYFGPIMYDLPMVWQELRLPDYIRVPSLLKAFGLTTRELGELNPALGASYLQGSRPLPKGYILHLPARPTPDVAERYAAIPETERWAQAPVPKGYKVRPGDTLSGIARRHRVSVESLRRLNSLRDADRIFPGQTLVVPDAAHPHR